MNWPPFPATKSSLGLKVSPVTGLETYQKCGRWERGLCRSRRAKGSALSNHRELIPAVSKTLKLWLAKSFVARLRPGTRPTTKFSMKAINIQLPIRLAKRILYPGAGPPRAAVHPRLLVAGSDRRCWYIFFRSLRAVLAGVLDRSAYDQISLGREVSVAFTSQGPVIYRYGWNNVVDCVSPTRPTNRTA